jgi:hypothetical protein
VAAANANRVFERAQSPFVWSDIRDNEFEPLLIFSGEVWRGRLGRRLDRRQKRAGRFVFRLSPRQALHVGDLRSSVRIIRADPSLRDGIFFAFNNLLK